MRRFARAERRHAGGQAGDRVADDGLRRLPQPPDAHLPLAGAGARQRAARQADRHRPALRPPRGPQGAATPSTRRRRPRAPASRRRSATSTAQSYPQVATAKAAQVEAAGKALGDIWNWNVFPGDEHQVGHVPQPHRPRGRHVERGRLLPLPRRAARDEGRQDDLAGLRDLPLAAGAGREGPGDPEDDRPSSRARRRGASLRRGGRSRIISRRRRADLEEVPMAKARRTTHRSSAGKKLYAVRDADGRFKDIQTYERAHRADLARKSKDELAADGHRQEEGRRRRRRRRRPAARPRRRPSRPSSAQRQHDRRVERVAAAARRRRRARRAAPRPPRAAARSGPRAPPRQRRGGIVALTR